MIAAGAKKDKLPAKTKNEAKADQIANGVESMKIDDTPRATSKNLDVLAEPAKANAKRAANFVVIGMLSFCVPIERKLIVQVTLMLERVP